MSAATASSIVADDVNGPATPAGRIQSVAPMASVLSDGSLLNCSTRPVMRNSRTRTSAMAVTTTATRRARYFRSRTVSSHMAATLVHFSFR